MFEDYAKSVENCLNTLEQTLRAADTAPLDEKRGKNALAEAEESIQQMAFLARSNATYKAQLAAFRTRLAELKPRWLRRVEQTQRAALLSGSGSAPPAGSDAAAKLRQKDTMFKAEQATRRLEEATRMNAETENVSLGVMGDLNRQREVMERARGNMGNLGNELDQAKGHVREIEKANECAVQ